MSCAYICFGIKFKEGYDFPWKYHYDLDSWWRKIKGFSLPVPVFDPSKEERCKSYEEKVCKYYEELDAFDMQNPLPIELVNYSSEEVPGYIVAIPRTCLTAYENNPIQFRPSSLSVSDQEIEKLILFVQTYTLSTELPQWHLITVE